jgi:hypothetical protein
VSISAAGIRRGGEKTIRAVSRAMLKEDAMNPNFNWAIVAERMHTLQAEADTAARARHAARTRRGLVRARRARRSRRGLAFIPAALGR